MAGTGNTGINASASRATPVEPLDVQECCRIDPSGRSLLRNNFEKIKDSIILEPIFEPWRLGPDVLHGSPPSLGELRHRRGGAEGAGIDASATCGTRVDPLDVQESS